METAHNQRGWPLIAIIVLALVISWPLAHGTKQSLSKIDSQSLLAETALIHPTPFAKVIKRDDQPRVRLDALGGDETKMPPESCLTKAVFDQYYHGKKLEYEKALAKRARCMSGYMQATVLDGRIANANASVSVLDDLIDLLARTKENLETKKTLDGIRLVGIPGGIETSTALENADNIAMACIERNGVKDRGTADTGTAVGRLDLANDLSFLYSARKHKESFEAAQKGIIDLNEKLKKEEERVAAAKRAGAVLDEETGRLIDPTTGKPPLDPETGKPLEGVSPTKMMIQGLKIINILKADFMPVDATLLATREDLTGGGTLEVRFTLERNAAGGTILDNPPKWITGPLWTVTALEPNTVAIGKPYFLGKLSIDAGAESLDVKIKGKTIISIPEPSLFKDFLETISRKIAEFQKEKTKFETRKRTSEKQLAALEKNNFNCI